MRERTYEVYDHRRPEKKITITAAEIDGVTDARDLGAGTQTFPRTVEAAVETIKARPREFFAGIARVVFAFLITAGGGVLGYLLATIVREPLIHGNPTVSMFGVTVPIATGALSITVFVGMLASVISLVESATAQYEGLDWVRAILDFTKALVAVFALALAIFVFRDSPADVQRPLTVIPLVFDSSRSVGVFSVFFENAEVADEYWENENMVPDGDVSLDQARKLWKKGTIVTPQIEADLKKFVAALARCSKDSAPQLQLAGYASSREFTRQEGLIIRKHSKSELLNLLASWTREQEIYVAIGELAKRSNIQISKPRVYKDLMEMYDARGTIDRVEGEEMARQEDLGRRVDIYIQGGKCSIAKLAEPAAFQD